MTEDEFDPLPADMMRVRLHGETFVDPSPMYLRMTAQEERDRAVIARIGGRELVRLYVEHAATDLHTGDNYVSGGPTCDPLESWSESELRAMHGDR